jgi:hypothetical protein
MSRIERLLRNYERFVSIPWPPSLAGPQRVWFLVYDKFDEQRIRCRVEEFQLATVNAGHQWQLIDLTISFASWMADQEYRESYFRSPEDLDILLPRFRQQVVQDICSALHEHSSPNSVFVIMGIGCLFGFAKVSDIVNAVAPDILGRLLVFFPGEIYENNNYRLLDARDGWNYLAVPITA